MNNPQSRWPSGKTCCVMVSVNLDAEAPDLLEARRDNLYGRYSYGRYGMRAGVWRLLDLFARLGIRATFFVPGLDAENNPAVIEAIREAGHEIAARGYAFENHAVLGDRERDTLMYAHRVLSDIVGMPPRGWRAPFGAVSHATPGHLADLGYLYDSSFQDDDFPYIMRSATGKLLVELPQFQFLDDAHLYEARHTHDRVLKTWKEEFDAMYDHQHFVNLTLSPRGDRGSGRASRVRVVEEFLLSVARRPGVYFSTGEELATWWKEAWPQSEPVGLGLAPFDASLARG